MRKIIGIGETILDIIFRNNQPSHAVPGGSTFNTLISLGRLGVPATFISESFFYSFFYLNNHCGAVDRSLLSYF